MCRNIMNGTQSVITKNPSNQCENHDGLQVLQRNNELVEDISEISVENIPDWINIEEESGIETINSCESNCESELNEVNFRNELSEWAITNQPPKYQLKQLIAICNRNLPFNLPSDPRTIMRTPRIVHIQTLSDGSQYWHHGVQMALEVILQGVDVYPDTISLNVNVDGLPIFESAKDQFWPVFCNIFELPHIEPFVVGIFCGKSKKFIFQTFYCFYFWCEDI